MKLRELKEFINSIPEANNDKDVLLQVMGLDLMYSVVNTHKEATDVVSGKPSKLEYVDDYFYYATDGLAYAKNTMLEFNDFFQDGDGTTLPINVYLK